MLTSKVTSKGQVTIPKQVRERLKVSTGDTLAYEIRETEVVLRLATPFDLAWHSAISDTMSEWASKEDEEAFRDL